MSYTNKELVYFHINFDNQTAGKYKNLAIVMTGSDWIDLPGCNLSADSVAVKAVKVNAPSSEIIVPGDSAISLARSDLLACSVVVASDSSLGTIYIENVEYSIDYANGTISIISGGNIIPGTSLIVWYQHYSRYNEEVDYRIDYQSGKIKRLASGAIADNQTIYIDFHMNASQVGEEAIIEAVAEANSVIESMVDPEGRFGADLTLQTSATYLAVSIACRMLAIDEMKTNGANSTRSNSWLAVSESYRKRFRIIT